MSGLGARAGVSRQMISYMERGICSPRLVSFLKLCQALDRDAAEIIHRATLQARGSRRRRYPNPTRNPHLRRRPSQRRIPVVHNQRRHIQP